MRGYEEKRDYSRMEVNCKLTYRLADSETRYRGQCTSISGAGISFLADHPIAPGKAMEINLLPVKSITPSMIAFIEVVRSTNLGEGFFEIAAVIKGIKAK